MQHILDRKGIMVALVFNILYVSHFTLLSHLPPIFSICTLFIYNMYMFVTVWQFFYRGDRWMKIIGLSNLRNIKSKARICGAHFEDKFFKNSKKNRLNTGALPTLYLGTIII